MGILSGALRNGWEDEGGLVLPLFFQNIFLSFLA